MRILLAQNYSLHELEISCAAQKQPRHHLWGADALRQAGHTVVTLGSPEHGFLRRLSELSRFRLGDLDRQSLLRRTARLNQVDLIVCAETRFARALELLRRARVVRTPLLGVLHPYEPRGWSERWAIGGFDRLLSLSSHASRQTATPSVVTTWGPDLSFPGYQPRAGTHVVMTGRINRNPSLVENAAREAGVPLTVHAGQVPYDRILADLCAALVVTIPLARTDGSFGLTELNEAIALGKPVLMTRNPYIDLDIEAVGCGRWIGRGDAQHWREELARMAQNPDEATEMGARGRAYAADGWSYERFCDDLTAAVAEFGA